MKLLPILQKALASGVDIVIHTKGLDSYASEKQESAREASAMMEQAGIAVHAHKELQQRYAIVDGSIVWYGSVDFLAFGRKGTDVLRFENPDIAGELLVISGEANSEQLMIEDIPT